MAFLNSAFVALLLYGFTLYWDVSSHPIKKEKKEELQKSIDILYPTGTPPVWRSYKAIYLAVEEVFFIA